MPGGHGENLHSLWGYGKKWQGGHVWSPEYVDALVLGDKDLDGNGATGNFGKTGSGLEDRFYVYQDANFNVTAVGNTLGQVDERYLYGSYGKVTVLDGSWAPVSGNASAVGWQYLHQGGRYDSATGLYSFRNRDYSPTQMRFTQVDPTGYGDGLNLYGFVADSPVNANDPSGLSLVRNGVYEAKNQTLKQIWCDLRDYLRTASGKVNGPSLTARRYQSRLTAS